MSTYFIQSDDIESIPPAGQQPADYGLSHDEFRPHQAETIDFCLSVGAPGQANVGVVEAPTGSGKSATARAVASRKKVVTVVRTKSLQEQYGDEYGFTVLQGRGNYACVHPDNVPHSMADECLYEDDMHSCEHAIDCPYLIQKSIARSSRMVALNYAYWLTAKWPRENPPDVLFLDEGHQLSDTVLDFVGCTIKESDRREWDLPPFPILTSSGGHGLFFKGTSPHDTALDWLGHAAMTMASNVEALKDSPDRKMHRKAIRLQGKIKATLSALQPSADDWFIRSGPEARSVGESGEPGFVARPLTARYHFGKFFLDGHATIAMSATIGDFDTFAEELGIPSFVSRRVPNQWPASVRPVRILDAPAMGQKARREGSSAFEEQARVIADAIKECPSDWMGVIHVTRKTEAPELAKRLARLGLHNRVWVPNEREGTDIQMQRWAEVKKKKVGAIAIVWSFWEGVNLLDEKICIVAKTPFPFLGDPYERERMAYSGKFFLQRTAFSLEQGLGRTRRGRKIDYDTDGQVNGLVAIADQNWRRVRRYLSASMQEAIVEDK